MVSYGMTIPLIASRDGSLSQSTSSFWWFGTQELMGHCGHLWVLVCMVGHCHPWWWSCAVVGVGGVLWWVFATGRVPQYFTLPHGFWQTPMDSSWNVGIPSGIRRNGQNLSFCWIPMESKWNSIPIQVHSARFQGPFQHIPGEILFQWIPSAIQMSCDLVWP